MFSIKKPLNNHTTEAERLLTASDWDFGYNPEALAPTTERMAALLRSVLRGTHHCSANPTVQKLVKNIDYAKCFLTSAEYFQKQIARATAAGDPPHALEELNRCNKDALDSAAKKLNESRPLWKEIKQNHFSAARARSR